MIWPLIAKIATGILAGKNSSAGGLANLAMNIAKQNTNSVKNMPEPQTIGG